MRGFKLINPLNNIPAFLPFDYIAPPLPGDAEELPGRCAPWPDLFENTDEYLIKLDVPGMRREDFSICYSAGRLTVTAQSPAPGQRGARGGLGRGFVRAFALPDNVEPRKIRAAVHEGVLTIHIPKQKEVATRQVTIV